MFSVQVSSVAQLCPTLCDAMDHSTPGLPVDPPTPILGQPNMYLKSFWINCDEKYLLGRVWKTDDINHKLLSDYRHPRLAAKSPNLKIKNKQVTFFDGIELDLRKMWIPSLSQSVSSLG